MYTSRKFQIMMETGEGETKLELQSSQIWEESCNQKRPWPRQGVHQGHMNWMAIDSRTPNFISQLFYSVKSLNSF